MPDMTIVQRVAESQYVFGILFIFLFLAATVAGTWLYKNLLKENDERERKIIEMQEKKRNNYKKFAEMIGLDVNKPVSVMGKHYFDSDEGLTIVLQGDDGTFWQNKLKTEAANHLIESLDFKSDIEDDYLIKEKTFVSLLCTIGGSGFATLRKASLLKKAIS
ncbi:hypothetical protein [Aneurinibacillus migulanus]|uniref:Uncharacterized protein n=1 Tax=Aneurinibacillus migulanus TaxID=47500 RepID=A0A0D1V433_ANEMI|nr:hypothetical protein [Aneurinibacillus migulanus]KIV54094.1 hypothetical protein TS65_19300 [Aneurinibacillus migulanus]KON97635.1 hypothetical protein AF333_21500 [Aneurinibacillus migulanus]MED0894382.1 hypothetical protein [Aneurinibacillus migulanus]MED1616992.1 hypothetical protein [Aneurinibacillus migulanus]SDJ37064.1 hypothetical protein SAMN04487909_116104 [Aneurinibacillus migulanus]